MPLKVRAKRLVYGRTHYHKYRNSILESNKRFRRERRQWIYEIKEENPCEDCGKYFPHYQMEFDHVLGKNRNVSSYMGSMPQLLAEFMLCELVCVMCHSKRTWERRQCGYKCS